jgi:hypothetical protein
MQIEAVSEMDSISNAGWEEIETIAQWNGRDLSTVNRKHHEERISSVALQRARFDHSQTGYVLCKSEKDSDSKSESKGSDDKVLSSEEDTKKSTDKDAQTDMKQAVSLGLNHDNKNDHSLNEARLKYINKIQLKNDKSLEIEAEVKYTRRCDRNEISDQTSGEINASYNF